jgi:hypothetical protein
MNRTSRNNENQGACIGEHMPQDHSTRVSLVMPMDALGVFQLTWAFETVETALSTIPKHYDDMIKID